MDSDGTAGAFEAASIAGAAERRMVVPTVWSVAIYELEALTSRVTVDWRFESWLLRYK